MNTYVQIYIYIYMYTSIHMYMYIYVYIHRIYIYIYIYTSEFTCAYILWDKKKLEKRTPWLVKSKQIRGYIYDVTLILPHVYEDAYCVIWMCRFPKLSGLVTKVSCFLGNILQKKPEHFRCLVTFLDRVTSENHETWQKWRVQHTTHSNCITHTVMS